jgi:hypothetical protein
MANNGEAEMAAGVTAAGQSGGANRLPRKVINDTAEASGRVSVLFWLSGK